VKEEKNTDIQQPKDYDPEYFCKNSDFNLSCRTKNILKCVFSLDTLITCVIMASFTLIAITAIEAFLQ
jgi:hypothetical protein